ncbi:MAG TPA: YceI family protein [Gemmatimonadales bacterium]|nr:YceI family protein [Gemmatimonadales bacterium]
MRPQRVLVLDSSPERRQGLVTMLRSAEHQVVSAPDARAAADALQAPEFDLLLLDLTTPDLDMAALRRAVFPPTAGEPDSLEAAERRHLALALRHTAGNKRQAALLLGISRSTLLNKVRKYGLALLAPLVFGTVPALHGQSRAPIPSGQVVSGTLSFDGHATVGDFVGKTDSVSGRMTGGGELSAVKGWVEAPVRTLKTGDKRRDKDLNKSMESGKYPTIRFELAGVTPEGGTADSVPVTLHGALKIHGETRKVDLPGLVVFKGPAARVRSTFPLNLKDYRIGGLSKMLGMLKMSENIEVHVDLLFGPGSGT